jgi:hypothetical protein
MKPIAGLLAVLVAVALALTAPGPAAASKDKAAAAANSSASKSSARKKGKRATITVRPRRPWRGYGFLPGYRPQPGEMQGVPQFGPRKPRREARYLDYYGNVRYGWGPPRYYRGRWNAGSFGPCWTQTPIGMVWNCGH